mgnify:CR=1 FL=1
MWQLRVERVSRVARKAVEGRACGCVRIGRVDA